MPRTGFVPGQWWETDESEWQRLGPHGYGPSFLWFGWASCSSGRCPGTINVDQRGGKTESERYQRLLAMTIWTGYVGSTLINVNGFEQSLRRTRGSTKSKKTWPRRTRGSTKSKKTWPRAVPRYTESCGLWPRAILESLRGEAEYPRRYHIRHSFCASQSSLPSTNHRPRKAWINTLAH